MFHDDMLFHKCPPEHWFYFCWRGGNKAVILPVAMPVHLKARHDVKSDKSLKYGSYREYLLITEDNDRVGMSLQPLQQLFRSVHPDSPGLAADQRPEPDEMIEITIMVTNCGMKKSITHYCIIQQLCEG